MVLLSILRFWSECLIPAWFLRNLYLQTTRRLQKEAAPLVNPTGPSMAKKDHMLSWVACVCRLPSGGALPVRVAGTS
jgi:hypothetical protein